MRAVGKRRKCPSLLIFNHIKKRQKTRYPSNLKKGHLFFWHSLIRAILTELQHFRWDLGSKHFALNSHTAVYSSLCMRVLAQTCRWQYSDVFIETLGAHTLLGTVIQLFIPASQHLYTDKPAGDLLWTNLRVVWEYLYSDSMWRIMSGRGFVDYGRNLWRTELFWRPTSLGIDASIRSIKIMTPCFLKFLIRAKLRELWHFYSRFVVHTLCLTHLVLCTVEV
jgi:hypothetical protein